MYAVPIVNILNGKLGILAKPRGKRLYSTIRARTTNVPVDNDKVKSMIKSLGPKDWDKLNPMWISGFVDGEGSFHIKINKNNKNKTGWSVQACFSIGLHQKDRALLELIQGSLEGAGSITKEGEYTKKYSTVHYQVTSVKDLTKIIIPHFDKYPLITQKRADFELFKMAVNLINHKEHQNIEGLQQIVNLKASMNLGLSDRLKSAFPNTHPAPRLLIKLPESIDLHWLAGLVSAEGCFFIEIFKHTTKIGFGVKLKFQITQHIRDQELLRKLINKLDCGRYETSIGRNWGNFVVTRFSDIESKILPLFTDYLIYGVKTSDLADFRKVVDIIKAGDHLTPEGLEEIRRIKAGMRKVNTSVPY